MYLSIHGEFMHTGRPQGSPLEIRYEAKPSKFTFFTLPALGRPFGRPKI